MAIEFREIDKGFYEIFVGGEHTGVEIVICTPGSAVLDPIGCAGAFDVEELEQILSKMRSLQNDSEATGLLQGDNKS